MRDIWTYSADRWGPEQANSYLDTIRAAIGGLRADSTQSRPAGDVLPACRRVSVGRHVVFFRDTEGAIAVIRLLHQRMDAGRWV